MQCKDKRILVRASAFLGGFIFFNFFGFSVFLIFLDFLFFNFFWLFSSFEDATIQRVKKSILRALAAAKSLITSAKPMFFATSFSIEIIAR